MSVIGCANILGADNRTASTLAIGSKIPLGVLHKIGFVLRGLFVVDATNNSCIEYPYTSLPVKHIPAGLLVPLVVQSASVTQSNLDIITLIPLFWLV